MTAEPSPDAPGHLSTVIGTPPLHRVMLRPLKGQELVDRRQRHHGLGTVFQFVLSSGDFRSRKPAREIFEAAVARIGKPASRIWFVGDTFEEDIVGASAVGLQPIWFTAGRSVGEFDPGVPVVQNWSEFLTLYSSYAA